MRLGIDPAVDGRQDDGGQQEGGGEEEHGDEEGDGGGFKVRGVWTALPE